MIVSKLLNYNSSRYSEDNHDGDIKEIDKDLITLFNCLSGRVRFGNGNTGRDGENVFGQWLTITTNAVANTEDTFNHSCGVIPVGYIIVWQDKAGSLYQGPTTGTSWTSSSIYLKCSIASVTFKLFLLK